MRALSQRSRHHAVTALQYRAVLVLLAANVLACMMNMLCLRMLGPARMETVGVQADASHADLEGRADNVATPERAAASPDATPARARAGTGAAAAAECVPCSSRPHGALPTTSWIDEWDPRRCRWTLEPGKLLPEAPLDLTMQYTLPNAQAFCMELGSECGGVTCVGEAGAATCSVRKTGPLQESGEATTHIKDCPSIERLAEAACRSTGPREPPEVRFKEDLEGAAVVVLAHNRADSLKTCLDSLLQQADAPRFRFFVSLDDRAAEPTMRQAVREASDSWGVPVAVWTAQPRVPDPAKHNKDQIAWFEYNAAKIAWHYWVVFERTFMEHKLEHAIFVEEDLSFAPDFLALFRSTAWLLEADSTVWCVSAWNDVGFSAAASDQCRLFRTTYFPGLGFLLPRRAWLRMREMWPESPTMGWDYWMRTAFRQEGKECIIPEVSRSHHVAKHGSSINQEKQLKLFEYMALASLKNTCGLRSPCRHFGDLSYLLAEAYEAQLRQAVASSERIAAADLAPKGRAVLFANHSECRGQSQNLGVLETPQDCAAVVLAHRSDGCADFFQWSPTVGWGCRCCAPGEEDGEAHESWSVYRAQRADGRSARGLRKDALYVLPYKVEELERLAYTVGLRPAGTKGAIPRDVRAEHHGVLVGRHLVSLARVLLVDRRSPRGYLRGAEQVHRSPKLVPTAAERGQSCKDACAARGLVCNTEQLNFLNTCPELMKHFECKWCAHQIGDDIPVYVPDETNMNYGQCLVTFISHMKCDSKHPSTQRLCACLPDRAAGSR